MPVSGRWGYGVLVNHQVANLTFLFSVLFWTVVFGVVFLVLLLRFDFFLSLVSFLSLG